MKLVLDVKREGQPFYDRPVYRVVSRPNTIYRCVAAAFDPAKAPAPITEVDSYERVLLDWRRPDGKGNLVPL